MQLKITDIPKEIFNDYILKEIVTPDGWVYIEISRRMYGPPHAAILTQQQLEKRLEKHGYNHSTIIPSFWTHK